MANPVTQTTFGATFKYGSPLVTVGHVISVGAVGIVRNTFDVMYHDSDDEIYETHAAAGKSKPITVKIGLDVDDADQLALWTAANDKTQTPFEIGIPGSTKVSSFSGYVVDFQMDDLPAEATEQTATIIIQPDGTDGAILPA